MRVAFSGSHRTGKSTLVGAVANLMPGFEVIDEPYRVLEEAGHEFSDPPSIADFEQQLKTSFELIANAPRDALFDRCPLDIVAYLQALDDDWDVEASMDDLRDAIARLDLIVVVSIEAPDRIAVAAHEDRQLRRRVNELVQHLVLDDPFGFGAVMLEVSGGLDERVRQVTRAMQIRAGA